MNQSQRSGQNRKAEKGISFFVLLELGLLSFLAVELLSLKL